MAWGGWSGANSGAGAAAAMFGQNNIIASIGDSIGGASSFNSATSKGHWATGPVAWARALSGQRFRHPLSHNLSVSGTALAAIAATAASVVALTPKPGFCTINGGTNDLAAATTLAAMKSSMTSAILTLLQGGVVPLVFSVPPMTGLTTAQNQKRMAFNTWLRALCAGRYDLTSAAGIAAYPLPILIDWCEHLENMATGGPLAATFLTDLVHPNSRGAYFGGKLLKQALDVLYPPRPNVALSLLDTYDATNNPAGNLMVVSGVNHGTMAGTGGSPQTLTGLTPTGSLAAGPWQAFRGVGTSTATMVLAKENPRTDILNGGERQRVTINCTSAGGAAEQYALYYTTPVGSQLVAGDLVEATARVSILSSNNLVTPLLAMTEGGAAGPQTVYDLAANVVNGTSVLPGEAMDLVMRTEPIVMGSGISYLILQSQFILNTTSGAASVDAYIADVSIRKVL